MFWATLATLAVYLLLQTALGILYLILNGHPGLHKDSRRFRAVNNLNPTHRGGI